MIHFLSHTFWGGVLATGIVHAVGTVVVFLWLAKQSACDRPSRQVSPSSPIGTTESQGKRGARVEPRFDDPPTRNIPDVAGDCKVVSLAVWKIRKLKGRDWPGPLVA